MQINKKQAFTLVELIVVITILAILGTIVFMAFGGYSKNARDSRRTSDLNNIIQVLELFKLKSGFYPEPTDTFNVTYSGAIAWTQGSFGDSTTQNVEKLDKKPTDPLIGNDYTYSVTNTKAEFEIATIYEGDNLASIALPIDQVHAAEVPKAIVRGTYNGKFVKTSTGSVTYILGAPSIITSEIISVDIETIISNKSFVYTKYSNLPSSYKGSNYTLNGGFNFGGGTGVVLFQGDFSTLTGEVEKLTFANKLDQFYSDSSIGNLPDFSEVTNIDIYAEEEGAITTVSNLLSHVFGKEYSYKKKKGNNDDDNSFVSCATLGQTFSNTTTYFGCDSPDVVICTGSGTGQIWALCNVGANMTFTGYVESGNDNPIATEATAGRYFQWGENIAWDYDGGTGATDNCTWNRDTQLCEVGLGPLSNWSNTISDTMGEGSDRWYDWSTTDNRGPCYPGYHVPTKSEWDIASTTLLNRNSFAFTLKLPMAGRRNNFGIYLGQLQAQGEDGFYWSSTPLDTWGNWPIDFWASIGYSTFTYEEVRTFGIPVRCIRN